jgi:hypothetical protein
MKKIILCFITLIVLISITGCGDGKLEPDLFKGIEGVYVSEDCVEYKDDVCGLYDCMVDLCWCWEGYPGPIFYVAGFNVLTEEDAMAAVQEYLDEGRFMEEDELLGEATAIVVERAVKLDDIFYNVFCDEEGDEVVYSVAADGSVFKTICGV